MFRCLISVYLGEHINYRLLKSRDGMSVITDCIYVTAGRWVQGDKDIHDVICYEELSK